MLAQVQNTSSAPQACAHLSSTLVSSPFCRALKHGGGRRQISVALALSGKFYEGLLGAWGVLGLAREAHGVSNAVHLTLHNGKMRTGDATLFSSPTLTLGNVARETLGNVNHGVLVRTVWQPML